MNFLLHFITVLYLSQTPTLEHYSTYTKEALEPVVYYLAKNLKSAESSDYRRAIKTKYSSHKLMKVSQVCAI